MEGKNPCLDMLKFGIHKCYEIKPDAHEEKYEAKTAVIDEDQLTKMILDLQKHKDKDFRSAYRFALISTLFFYLDLEDQKSKLENSKMWILKKLF